MTIKPIETVYLTCPHQVDADRYEKYYYLLAHHFVGAIILEARELFPIHEDWIARWPSTLEHLDILVFLRHEKLVTSEMWDEISQANKAGVQVLMACTASDDTLLLTDFEELRFAAQGKGMRKCTIIKQREEVRA